MFLDLSGFYEFLAILRFSTPKLIGIPNVLPFCAPEPEFGRPKSFGLSFSGLDRSTDSFGSTESGVFGRPMGFHSVVFWVFGRLVLLGRPNQRFLVNQLDFRSADFGLGCFPSLVFL